MGNESTCGYAEFNGLGMYYEVHGTFRPLLLLHGAFGTIESCFAGLLPEGFPSVRHRDEHLAGLPNAFARLEQAMEE